MSFNFCGRTFSVTDRLKLASPLITPPGAGLIGLARPTLGRILNHGFYSPSGDNGWVVGRGPTYGSQNRLGLYRPQRAPTVVASAAAASGSITTGSFTPSPYSVLFAIAAVRRTSATPTAATITDSLGNTWTLVPGADASEDDGTAFLRLRVYYLVIGATSSSMTVSSASASANHQGVVIVQVIGGSVSFGNIDTGTGTAGAATATLPSTPSTTNFILGAFYDRNFTSPITPPAGFTELVLSDVGTNGKLQVAIDDNTTATALAWNQAGDSVVIALGLELRQMPLIEHSSAVWADDVPNAFFAFSASASEHYLAMNNAGSLEKITTTIPIDTTSALALGRFDWGTPRGGFTGDEYWIGVVKAIPPLDRLDAVLRQLAPPTTLAPWLAHLFPLQGRSPELCVLTGASLAVDSGTSIANVAVPQPQEDDDDPILAVPRRRVRLTQRNASGNTSLAIDAGPLTEAAAIIVQIPDAGGTAIGVAANGDALTTATLPSAAPAQQGNLVVGAPILDGVAQSEAGTADIGAIVTAPAWTSGIHESLWGSAADFLRPRADPINLVAEAGSPQIVDLQPLIQDPAMAGYTMALSDITPGLTISADGTRLLFEAAAEGVYDAVLTITSLHSLAPAVTTTVRLTLTQAGARWPNGYRWRARINLLPWNASGTIANFLLPFAEVDPAFRSVANGGYVESADARDFRLETAAGVKISHVLLAYDPVIGLIAGLGNIAGRNIGVAEAGHAFVGKPGLPASEEDAAGVRASGLLFAGIGRSASDFSGLGRHWTTNVDVGADGMFNGSTSYRARTSSEMDGLTGLTVVAAASSNEAAGRTQEILNVAPDDVADLALRLGSGGNWVFILDAGGQLLAMQSELGLYYPGRTHAVAGVWSSGTRPSMYVDGALVDPVTPPAVATGTTSINEVLELGRGNRPPGTASWWNGPIGPVLAFSRALSRAEIECLTAALSQPRRVYGLGGFKTVDTAAVPPIAQPVEVSVSADTVSAPIDVQAAAYNPDGLALTTTVGTPTSGSASVAADGKVLLSLPAAAANQLHYAPYSLTSGPMSTSSIIWVSVKAVTQPPPPSTDSILPTLYQYTGATRNVTPANAQSTINSAANGDIIVLAVGDYGALTIPASKSIWVRGAVAPFTDLNCTPVFNTADEMTSATDHSPRDRRVTGLRATSQLARVSTVRIGAGGNVRLSNLYSTTTNGDCIRWEGAYQRACIDHCWIESGEGRNVSFRQGTPSDYMGTAPEAVSFKNIYYADSRRDPTGGFSSAGEWTDYGNIVHGTMRVYFEDNIFYGGYNHSISMKGGAGKTFGRFNRCVFAAWNQQNSGGNTNQLQIGQNGDNYTSSVGDITCGPMFVTNCTFIGFNHPSGFRLAAISYQNAVSIEISGCVFGRWYNSGVSTGSTSGGNFRMTYGDTRGTPSGVTAWSGDINIHDNEFHNNHRFTAATAISGYGNCRILFSNNNAAAGVMPITANGHQIVLGPNPGFST